MMVIRTIWLHLFKDISCSFIYTFSRLGEQDNGDEKSNKWLGQTESAEAWRINLSRRKK